MFCELSQIHSTAIQSLGRCITNFIRKCQAVLQFGFIISPNSLLANLRFCSNNFFCSICSVNIWHSFFKDILLVVKCYTVVIVIGISLMTVYVKQLFLCTYVLLAYLHAWNIIQDFPLYFFFFFLWWITFPLLTCKNSFRFLICPLTEICCANNFCLLGAYVFIFLTVFLARREWLGRFL